MALNASTIFEEGLVSFSLYPYQTVLHPLITVIGVPLNLFVAAVLVTNSKLHNVRNFIWMGVVVSNLIYFLLLPVEYFIFYEENYTACQVVAVIAAKPYLILLINLSIATCDRLVYTIWPEFHQKHVTVLLILAIQVLCSAFIFLALTFQFWGLKVPIRCGVEPSNIRATLGVTVLFTVLCIGLKVAIYFLLLKQSKGIGMGGFVTRQIQVNDLPLNSQSNSLPHENVHFASRVRLFDHDRFRKIRKMEQNATMNLVIGLIPLCLFTFLSYSYALCQALCKTFFGQCETLNSMEVYFRDLTLLHASTDLLVYIHRSLEFRHSARKMFCR